MTADVALRMGLPIYAVVAYTHTASDRQGRSVPAPGQGIMSGIKEMPPTKATARLLDRAARATALGRRLAFIDAEYADRLEDTETPEDRDAVLAEAAREKAAARQWWGNMGCAVGDQAVSPLRAGLAMFGLTADDITLASFHGTSTKANDTNESRIIQTTLAQLGRTKGNSLPVVCQKWLTAHPKAAAALWMMNGAIQALNDGVIPGNRNADNIDPELEQHSLLHYPNESYPLAPGAARAALVDSFGFGQAGAQVLLVHPDLLLSAIGDGVTLEAYAARRSLRELASHRFVGEVRAGRRPLVTVKDDAPYTKADQVALYSNPAARASYQPQTCTWQVTQPRSGIAEAEADFMQALGRMASTGAKGYGFDLEPHHGVNIHSRSFIDRNFTAAEQQYCHAGTGSDVQARFTGRWCAKEAVLKAISSVAPADCKVVRSPADPLRDIEVLPTTNGAPEVVLHGDMEALAAGLGITSVALSISHSGGIAGAMAAAH